MLGKIVYLNTPGCLQRSGVDKGFNSSEKEILTGFIWGILIFIHGLDADPLLASYCGIGDINSWIGFYRTSMPAMRTWRNHWRNPPVDFIHCSQMSS